MQKLDRQQRSVERAVLNNDLALRIDSVFVDCTEADANLMDDNRQIPQARDLGAIRH
jgi:hypothetical protein